MKYIMLIFFSLALFRCDNKINHNPSDLLGHWHLHDNLTYNKKTETINTPFDLYYKNISLKRIEYSDLKTSEIAFIDTINFNIQFNNYIFDDQNAIYTWEWLNDSTVNLFNDNHNPTKRKMTLHRIKNDFNHQHSDYFRNFPAPLDLPLTNLTPRPVPKHILNSYIYLKQIQENLLRYKLDDRVVDNADEEDFFKFDEQRRSRLSKPNQRRMTKAVFTDANTQITSLHTIAKHYQSSGRDTLFFAVGPSASSDIFHVNYRPLSINTLLKSEGVLQDLIK